MRTYNLYTQVTQDVFPGAFVTIIRPGILRAVLMTGSMNTVTDDSGFIAAVTYQAVASIQSHDQQGVLCMLTGYTNLGAAGVQQAGLNQSLAGLNFIVQPLDRFYLCFDVSGTITCAVNALLYVDD